MIGAKRDAFRYAHAMENSNTSLCKPYYIASVSGGKDSLYMIKHIIDTHRPLDEVVHMELPFCNPLETKVSYVIEDMCKQLGIKFTRLKQTHYKPDITYKFRGRPTPKKDMWCHDLFKEEIYWDYVFTLEGKLVYSYIGIAADEPKRILRNNPLGLQLFPLFEDGITEEFHILPWARNCEIFEGWYNEFDRLGCPSCPYMSWSGKKELERAWLINHGYGYFDLNSGCYVNPNK